MKKKACQQMSFTDWFWKVSCMYQCNGLSVLLTGRKKGKIMLLVCLLSCYRRYHRQDCLRRSDLWPPRFLVEDFFLLVIKPPGTYFNNELLPSCKLFFPRYQRSSACSAGSNSFWQTLHWKLRRAATFLNTQCTFLARFLQQQLE